LLGVMLGGLFVFVIVSYIQLSKTAGNLGGTSEIATIITFLLGVLVFQKAVLFALIIMVLLLVLLIFKPSLHGFVKKLTREELHAIIMFVIMSALVIPFLPDDNFGPYDLWNLKEIWKMVVLVSGISLIGYMIVKILGDKGALIAGLVGGLVSSTAVSLTFSRRSKITSATATSFFYAMGIISACTIMFPRILFEVFVVNRALAQQLLIPVILVTIAGFGAAFLIYKIKKGKSDSESLPLKNPLNFSTAIKFALLFAGIQWLVKYCSEEFGNSGTYLAGAISGITDVDAITLSMAKIGTGGEQSVLAINTILLAALSNTLVKFIIVMTVGSVQLRKTAFIGFCAIFLTGLAYFCYNIFVKI
ncbi:MAG TPA: DUF4010 domain-containing protein, partial [Chitinophagaceae bacterium]|nr:DUF4010 domain-containing protein [Chitinophagaceae bacterium]